MPLGETSLELCADQHDRPSQRLGEGEGALLESSVAARTPVRGVEQGPCPHSGNLPTPQRLQLQSPDNQNEPAGQSEFQQDLQTAMNNSLKERVSDPVELGKLQERLAREGRVLEDVASDGHCQFLSIAKQMERFRPLYGGYTFRKVREDIAEWLRKNRMFQLDRNSTNVDDLSKFIPMEKENDWVRWCDRVEDTDRSQAVLWGDNLTLVAAANVYGRPIKVWLSSKLSQGAAEFEMIDPILINPDTSDEPFEIAHIYEVHFQSVRRINVTDERGAHQRARPSQDPGEGEGSQLQSSAANKTPVRGVEQGHTTLSQNCPTPHMLQFQSPNNQNAPASGYQRYVTEEAMLRTPKTDDPITVMRQLEVYLDKTDTKRRKTAASETTDTGDICLNHRESRQPALSTKCMETLATPVVGAWHANITWKHAGNTPRDPLPPPPPKDTKKQLRVDPHTYEGLMRLSDRLGYVFGAADRQSHVNTTFKNAQEPNVNELLRALGSGEAFKTDAVLGQAIRHKAERAGVHEILRKTYKLLNEFAGESSKPSFDQVYNAVTTGRHRNTTRAETR
jgi:hypothetical protein